MSSRSLVLARGASVALLVSGLTFAGSVAHGQKTDRQYTEIAGSGQSLYRIAIPRPLVEGAVTAQAKTAQAVLTRDLTLVGLFKVLEPKGFLANLRKEGLGIEPTSWANVGAQAVVKSKLVRIGRKVISEWYLYDVGQGTTPVLKKTYTGRNARKLAHRFGNDIVLHYTKHRGVFLTKIAFAAGNRERKHIYVMDFDGHGAYRLSKTGDQNLLPAWSPSGQIAYTGYLWRNPDLYLVAAGGGRARRISRRPGLNVGAAFSPNGASIALTLTMDGNSEIYLISPSGAIQRRLTNQPGIDNQASWSPDGSQLAFVSNRAGSPQIYLMGANGGGARRLTFAGSYNQEPAWCPDPARPVVAFTARDDAGNYDIFTINIKTGELKRLTQGQGSNKSPSWSPDGRLIVFSSSRGGLWLMNPDGFNQQQVYRGRAENPRWSKSY